MKPLWLRVRAPFAAFRWLQAGVYRATSPTMPPSTAWGLVLNIAGIETRDGTPATVTLRKRDVPHLEVSVGEYERAQADSLYQQLHGYPVGNSGQELAERSHGSKYWIAPARRELLIDIDLLIGVRNASVPLEERLRAGLAGELPRYGLPFLGDNNFLVDRIELLETPGNVFWYCRAPESSGDPLRDTCRLTIDIDREDSARTSSAIFRRQPEASSEPPEESWTRVPAA